jgi:hypothetical protein
MTNYAAIVYVHRDGVLTRTVRLRRACRDSRIDCLYHDITRLDIGTFDSTWTATRARVGSARTSTRVASSTSLEQTVTRSAVPTDPPRQSKATSSRFATRIVRP